MFQSLAAARKRDPEMFNAVQLKDFSTKLSKEIRLIRGAHVRAVLLDDGMSPRLIFEQQDDSVDTGANTSCSVLLGIIR